MNYDLHDNCRRESQYWREQVEKAQVIKQVVQVMPDGTHQVLQVIQVHAFNDGTRILVR